MRIRSCTKDAKVAQKHMKVARNTFEVAQKMAKVARALIRKSQILILDDSTSALDVKTEAELWEALEKEQATMLVVTQKIRTAKTADKILLLEDGNVVGFGSHEQLIQSNELYRNIAVSQQELEVE